MRGYVGRMSRDAPDPGSSDTSERLAALRREYGDAGLDVGDLADTPVASFERWLQEAIDSGLHEPNAMVVSTVTADGRPDSRMVLLKGVDERGFVFYSNYESAKGEQLGAHPRAALLFPWHDLQRQVRVEGPVERVSREETEAYWAQRPRGSQLGAVASPQSREVASREGLDELQAAAEARHEGGEVPVPDHWGGYRVQPETVELWQGRKGRMHDRLVFRRDGADHGDGWRVVRLAP